MKKICSIIVLTAASLYGFGQDVDKLIKQDDVERIIKTLSADDMQGRATFTPGIEKAAQFIEGEYKKTGLLPMQGNTGYRQNFTMVKNSSVNSSVTINGVKISADSIAIVSPVSFSWNTGDAETVITPPDMVFQRVYNGFASSGKRLLVYSLKNH